MTTFKERPIAVTPLMSPCWIDAYVKSNSANAADELSRVVEFVLLAQTAIAVGAGAAVDHMYV
jgi:hypothetical protein